MRGKLGEVHAEQVLKEYGMTVLSRNVALGGGEIDLIALDGDVIAFVEVKTRTGSASGLEAVTKAKQRRICRAALLYMVRHALTGRQARFDVLEIRPGQVNYIKNAFPYCGPAF